MFNVQAATSAELVSFYNEFSGNPVIKKFADRATAEKRVTALIERLNAEAEANAKASTSSSHDVAVVEAEEETTTDEVSSDDEETAEEEAARLEAEAAADTAGPVQKAKAATTATRRSNSAGVAASWADPAVAAARLIRDGVIVRDEQGRQVGPEYRSTRAAFRELRLPDSLHIRFRLKLKEAKRAVFEHNGVKYFFEIA